MAGLTGQVDIEIDGVRRPLKMEEVIPTNARIITEEDSKLILAFVDMTTVVIGPESEIMLTARSGKESKLKLVAGNIWANVKKMVKYGTMEVEMNQAVAGIKGTSFVCEEKERKSVLKVFEGAVDFRHKMSGELVNVKGGEKVEADVSKLSKAEPFDISEEIQSLPRLIDVENINWEESDEKNEEEAQPIQKTKDKPESKIPKQELLIAAIIAIITIVVIFTGLKLLRRNKK